MRETLTEYLCLQCGDKFLKRKRWDRIVQFCSRGCFSSSKIGKPAWNKGIPMREETKRIQSEQRKGRHFSPKTEFTSDRVKGESNTNWKGGKFITYQGYRHVLNPDHPLSNIRGYVPEQVLVAERYLKRHLTKEEVVHHINFMKDDNRSENLYVFSNKTEHARHHKNLLLGKEPPKVSNLLD